MSEHHCPNCDDSAHPGSGQLISSAPIYRSKAEADRAQRIRDAEAAVIAAAEAQAALGSRTGNITDYLYPLACKATSDAVRALHEARK